MTRRWREGTLAEGAIERDGVGVYAGSDGPGKVWV